MPRAWTLTLTVILFASMLASSLPARAASADIVAKLDVPLTGNAAVFEPVSGKFYSLGGRQGDGSYTDAIYEVDGHSNPPTIRKVASLPVVTGATSGGRQSAAAAVMNGKVFLFGGAAIVSAPNPQDPSQQIQVPKAIKDIVEFNPATGVARTLPAQLPYGAWGAAAAGYAGRIFVFGGFTFDISETGSIKRRDSIATFDPNDVNPAVHSISTLGTTLPYAVQDAAAVLVGQHVYLFAGLMDSTPPSYECPPVKYYNQSSGQYDDVTPKACTTDIILRFNPSTENVNGVFSHLPYRAQFVSAAVVDNKAYVPGARLGDGAASTAIVAFDPTQNDDARVKILKPALPNGNFASGTASDGAQIFTFGGRSSNSAALTANVTRIDPRATAPWAPRTATARATGSTVALAWDVPVYDGDAPVTGYNVYRAGDDGVESLLGKTATLTYSDSGLTPGAPYVYRITALNNVGESATSARATTFAEILPPGPVSSFQAFAGNGEVALRWTPPSDTGGAAITGYRVYVDSSGTPARSIPPAETGATITGLTNGVSYSFVLKAGNTKGDGAASPTVQVTPKAVPQTPENVVASSGPTGVTISWAAPASPVRAHVLLRGTNPAQIFPIANLTGTDTQFLDTSPVRGRSYYYEVQATNDIGASPPSPYAIVSLVSKPGAPTDLSAISLPGSIRLTWKAPLDSGEADPATITYQVRRASGDAARPVTVATDLKGLAYEDKGLIANKSYTYTIVAFNGLESDPSSPVASAAKAIENKPPTAAILVPQTVVVAKQDIMIDASGSSDPDGTIAAYTFDFGDGTRVQRVTTPSATHSFVTNGTYTVSLVVTDNRGAESRPSTATIIVGDPNQVPDAQTPVTNDGTPAPTKQGQPGSSTPKGIPGFEPALVALAVVAIAGLVRRRA